ncbi:hypothetical protein ACNR90_001007 [Candidozyma auris]|nr:hypothetical protein QG37_01117 [[Candida] auris]
MRENREIREIREHQRLCCQLCGSAVAAAAPKRKSDQPSTRRELTMVKITSAAYGVRGQKAAGQKGKKEREREREREKKEKESQAFAYFLFALAVETLPLRPQWVGS